jgi:hypothetical protein
LNGRAVLLEWRRWHANPTDGTGEKASYCYSWCIRDDMLPACQFARLAYVSHKESTQMVSLAMTVRSFWCCHWWPRAKSKRRWRIKMEALNDIKNAQQTFIYVSHYLSWRHASVLARERDRERCCNRTYKYNSYVIVKELKNNFRYKT